MKPSTATKYRVSPFNIKNGNKAPYFIVEPSAAAKRDEVAKLAASEFKQRSSLSKYPNWDLEVEKI
jgi:hypothetical protein